MTVVDQVRPWLTPSSALATRTHVQFGAHIRRRGTGAATSSYDDIERARTILVCGANATENHPVVGARIKQAAIRGANLVVVDPHPLEDAQHLAVDVGLGDPDPRVARHVAIHAAVVGIGFLPLAGLLVLPLAGDRVAAMAARDDLARIGKNRLHSRPQGRLVLIEVRKTKLLFAVTDGGTNLVRRAVSARFVPPVRVDPPQRGKRL